MHVCLYRHTHIYHHTVFQKNYCHTTETTLNPALLCKRGTSAGKIHFFELLFIWKNIKISDHLHGKGLRLHKMESGKCAQPEGLKKEKEKKLKVKSYLLVKNPVDCKYQKHFKPPENLALNSPQEVYT